MSHKVFWSEPIPFARESLRRYCDDRCSGKRGYHSAEVVLGEIERPLGKTSEGGFNYKDPRWPTKCDACDYVFVPEDHWQHNVTRLYEGDGKRFILAQAPVGAMWDATWFPESFGRGDDGIALIVMTPGGDWHVDGRASNCTRPDDKKHKCWVRIGDPRTGIIDVGKMGDTCAAGAGSIMIGDYHGFLQNGILT